MKNIILLLFFMVSLVSKGQAVYFRINQLGYFPYEHKTAILFSKQRIEENINLINVKNGKVIKSVSPRAKTNGNWGVFDYYYEVDFSEVSTESNYFLETEQSKQKSAIFGISNNAFSNHHETLLAFMRQQRCGYNPALEVYCHQKDGYSFYGPMKDTTFVDARGGWHDAGDQLKYLITGSYATAHLLKTYELYANKFDDHYDALGKLGANGIPDILDEAKWGLDWILKLHFSSKSLIHQVADDRDHKGFKMPENDNADYGWGANSYRPAYFADGKPQGLKKYKSEATGVANLAGRSAAAMAIAARIWKYDTAFARQCKSAALSLYQLGREKEGYQQGNSYGAPYRYNENTWNDDMEWGAAELFKLTKEPVYLEQAKKYALASNTIDSWTVKDTMSHYQLYPFLNMGHFVLHELVEKSFQKKLEGYYEAGIKHTLARAKTNPFGIGVPFIWCSNNLVTSLAGQLILYQKMTRSQKYNDFLIAQRDWLFGRNPWGSSMFTNIPEKGESPIEVHTSLYILSKKEYPGGLVDGPVYASIYKNLIGIYLSQPDEFAEIQNNYVIYHDDTGDYSTNEPTMDGTAGSLLMMVHWGTKK